MDKSSELPVSLNMANPVTGHPFDFGSVHWIVIELGVVAIFLGGGMLEGTRHAYIVDIGLSGD